MIFLRNAFVLKQMKWESLGFIEVSSDTYDMKKIEFLLCMSLQWEIDNCIQMTQNAMLYHFDYALDIFPFFLPCHHQYWCLASRLVMIVWIEVVRKISENCRTWNEWLMSVLRMLEFHSCRRKWKIFTKRHLKFMKINWFLSDI